MIKNKKSDLSHLRIIESTIWVHISKEKTKKLNDRFWKNIHVSYEDENQYRIYDSRTNKIHIIRDVKFDEIMYLRDQFDSDDNADDFWTHENDKLLNSNFEIDDSNTSISSKWRSKLKTIDNKIESSDLNENIDSVRAHINDLTNVLNQIMKNLNLKQKNFSENFSERFSVDDDSDDQTDEKIQRQLQTSRQSGRKRKTSKLAERII